MKFVILAGLVLLWLPCLEAHLANRNRHKKNIPLMLAANLGPLVIVFLLIYLP